VLRHPDGTAVVLIDGAVGGACTHTVLDDEALGPLSGAPPYTGAFRPASPLSAFDDKPAAGAWTLEVEDDVAGGSGTLRGFSLAFNGLTRVSPDVPHPILDESAFVSELAVADDLVVADAEVTLTITHGWTSDLEVQLILPSFQRVTLAEDQGGFAPGAGFLGTTFDDEATASLGLAFPLFLGRFLPMPTSLPLSAVDGASSAGLWGLRVRDDELEGQGTLDGWSLHLVPQTLCPGQAAATAYGAGLAGTLGAPALASDHPVLGEPLHLELGNSSGAPAPGLLVLGLAPAALPFKGGTLLVSPALQVPLVSVPPSLSLSATLPATASLCGQHLYLQWIQADPGAPGGIALSAGLELLLGS
jgi:subtilisin-like proprotein convertase family protein